MQAFGKQFGFSLALDPDSSFFMSSGGFDNVLFIFTHDVTSKGGLLTQILSLLLLTELGRDFDYAVFAWRATPLITKSFGLKSTGSVELQDS